MKYFLGIGLLFFSAFVLSEYQATQYLQTNSLSQNETATHIVNTSDTAQMFTGTLYDRSGRVQGEARTALSTVEIPAKGRLVVTSADLELLFGVSAWTGPAVLEIFGATSFEVMSKLTNPSGLITNTNCVRESSVHNIEGFDSPAVTFVRFINIGDKTMYEIEATLYDQSGNIIGRESHPIVKQLLPKASAWLTRDSLSNFFGDTWQGEAYLEITTPDEDLRLLSLNYVDSSYVNFSCYEAAASTESGGEMVEEEPSEEAMTEGVTYRVTFVAEWSAETHPGAYPASAHFSPLVAVTHNSDVEFWSSGDLASNAVEDVAELGVTSGMNSVIADEISMGNAHDNTTGNNLNSPGSASVTLTATTDYSLLTLISMVAPSPDWFVGVNSLDLMENGEWRSEVTVDLFAYDAGTEEGTGFSLSNAATSPAEPITAITTEPFPSGSPRLGQFQIELIEP